MSTNKSNGKKSSCKLKNPRNQICKKLMCLVKSSISAGSVLASLMLKTTSNSFNVIWLMLEKLFFFYWRNSKFRLLTIELFEFF